MNTGLAQLVLTGCGALVGAGIWLAVYGRQPAPAGQAAGGAAGPVEALAERIRVRLPGWSRRQVLAAVGVGVVVLAVTRWPVAALLAVPGVLVLPGMLGPDREHATHVARVEAVAGWAEMLRDTLSAAAGLEQAITATEPIAPAPIAAQVRGLAGQLRAGVRLRPALDRFAAEVADPTADMVVAALRLAAAGQARDLAGLLGALAASARDQAGMRLRLAAARARTRTTVRVILATTLVLACVLILANRGYLAAYDTPTGQLVLLAVGGLFATGLVWLGRLSRLRQHPRLLSDPNPAGEGVGAR